MKRKKHHNEKTFNQSLIGAELGGAPVNRVNWSAESQRSYSYMNVYTDLAYRCRYCRGKAVFTAKAQKYAYEVKKRYIDQKRVLCQSCFHDMHAKRDALEAIESRWRDEKNTLQNDIAFLRDWLAQLLDYQRYTEKSNHMIRSLEKRIERLEER